MNAQNRKNFAKFREQLNDLCADLDDSARRIASQMADVGQGVTKKNTPVGNYERQVSFTTKRGKKVTFNSGYKNISKKAAEESTATKKRFRLEDGRTVSFTVSGKKNGGTLRRGWIKSKTRKAGNSWVSGYANNVDYAIYVNNGHRTVNKDGATVGYVKGVRMLEQGIDEARRQTESLFRAEITRVKNKTGF